MTGENPKSIELMEQMYREIRKLDVPKSNISGVLDRVKYSIYSRIPNVSREEASRMLARYVFYDLDQKDNNVTERLNQELQQRAFDKRKHLEELAKEYNGKIILGDTSFEDWLGGLDLTAIHVCNHNCYELA